MDLFGPVAKSRVALLVGRGSASPEEIEELVLELLLRPVTVGSRGEIASFTVE